MTALLFGAFSSPLSFLFYLSKIFKGYLIGWLSSFLIFFRSTYIFQAFLKLFIPGPWLLDNSLHKYFPCHTSSVPLLVDGEMFFLLCFTAPELITLEHSEV